MLNGWDVDYQFCKNMVDGLGINASTMLGELRDSNRTSETYRTAQNQSNQSMLLQTI